MAFGNGPKIVTDGLVLSLDASDRNSYSGSGTAWNNLSGNGLNVTLANSPTYITNPNSLLFDGVNAYGVTGNNTLTSTTNSLSFDFWVNPSGTSTSSQTILAKDTNSAPPHLLIRRTTSTNLSFNAQLTNGSATPIVSTNFFVGSIGSWINIQITFNYTTGEYNAYKNGILFHSTTNVVSNFPSTNVPIYISSFTSPGFLPWTGNISVCKMYNRILSATEVLQNYNALKSRFNLN
jgi:hypothetical protein